MFATLRANIPSKAAAAGRAARSGGGHHVAQLPFAGGGKYDNDRLNRVAKWTALPNPAAEALGRCGEGQSCSKLLPCSRCGEPCQPTHNPASRRAVLSPRVNCRLSRISSPSPRYLCGGGVVANAGSSGLSSAAACVTSLLEDTNCRRDAGHLHWLQRQIRPETFEANPYLLRCVYEYRRDERTLSLRAASLRVHRCL